MKLVLTIVALLAQAPTPVPANLIGAWALEGFRGAAPLGLRHERALCGAVLMASLLETPDGSDGEQVGSLGTIDGVIVIAASPGGLLIERKYTGSAGAGALSLTYPTNGSVSQAVALGEVSLSGKIAVAGSALNVDTTITRGKDATQIACTVHEVFEANGGGMLQVSARAGSGQGTSSTQTFTRKTSPDITHDERFR